MKNVQKKRKGFTLAELVVVVTILGILMVIAISRFSTVSDSANERAFQANHKLAASAITMYMADNAGAKPAASDSSTADGTETNDSLGKYISASTEGDVGMKALNDKPKGAKYVWDGTELVSTYTKPGGTDTKTLKFKP